MRIPLSWLQDYLPLSSKTPKEVAHLLTGLGIEVDYMEFIGKNLEDVVVVRVLEAEKHPSADKLKVASVTDGTRVYQIVCGAANCRKGMKTALAKLGAVLEKEGKPFVIGKAKIRGIESEGMLSAADELGLEEKSEGILELPEEYPEGMSLAEIYSDVLLDLSFTPNLGHCMSVLGVARELAAGLDAPLHHPVYSLREGGEKTEQYVSMRVVEKEECPRYTCRLIRNVKVGPSPDWLKKRLEKCGIRSVNNVVDITQYVLLERGQPLHAFDFDKIEDLGVVVRKAKEGEAIVTLDGTERKLNDRMLVIADGQKPLAIAGVMGGKNSEVTEESVNILLESAYFDPLSIRKTSKQLGLQTEASKKFERGVDPHEICSSLDRAASLIAQVAGGEVQRSAIDCSAREFPSRVISCRLSKINSLIGRSFSRGEVEDIFRRLQLGYQWDGQDQFSVKVPPYRHDITAEIDLIEEVARLYGYAHLPRKKGRYIASVLPSHPLYFFEKELRERLIGQGLQEFLTCDLVGPALLGVVQEAPLEEASFIQVLNPTSIEQSILRTSLLPGLLQVAKYNVDHGNSHLAGFEIGRIHFRDKEGYREESTLAFLMMGRPFFVRFDQDPQEVDFFDLKGVVENLLSSLGVVDYECRNLKIETFHPGRQASIFVGGLEIGSMGEVHPAIQRRLDVPRRILFAELNIHDLMQVQEKREKITPLPLYPASDRDWTFTVEESVPFAKILAAIKRQQSPLLETVLLQSVYRAEKLGPGKLNMTLHFVYRDSNKTIEQTAVDREHERITQAVLQTLS